MSDRFIQCFILTLFIFLGMSCRSFLEVGKQDSKIDGSDVFNDPRTATMYLVHIYAEMFNQYASPGKIAVLTGVYSDELNPAPGQYQEFYENKITAGNMYTGNLWTAAYLYIRIANEVYAGCQQSVSLHDTVKNQLMGEALFIRSYLFFYLRHFYGDIPIPLTADASVNTEISRTQEDVVDDRIIADLLEAQGLIRDNYVDADSKGFSYERIRPNKATVTAFLARVYLYKGNYEAAEKQASAVISMNDMYTLETLDKVFLKNSQEAIWQLAPETPNLSNINTSEGSEFIIKSTADAWSKQTISTSLLNAFEQSDQRKTQWIGAYTDSSTPDEFTTYYFPYKYKVSYSDEIREYSMMFRLAEMYLIRAECKTHLGQLPSALADLNKIRGRAGLPAIKEASLDTKALIAAIMQERRVELFTEQGHYWLDMKRTGAVDSIMTAVTAQRNNYPWDVTKKVWPIPTTELGRAHNVKQNPGY